MKRGLKIKARNHVFNAFSTIKITKKKPPLLVLKRAVLNIAPVVALRKIYRSGRGLQIPYMVSFDVSLKIALRLLIKYARERSGYRGFPDKLAAEINDAYLKTGSAYEQKLNIYRIANDNATNIRYLK
jgi:small subunit ribosomal protein S7